MQPQGAKARGSRAEKTVWELSYQVPPPAPRAQARGERLDTLIGREGFCSCPPSGLLAKGHTIPSSPQRRVRSGPAEAGLRQLWFSPSSRRAPTTWPRAPQAPRRWPASSSQRSPGPPGSGWPRWLWGRSCTARTLPAAAAGGHRVAALDLPGQVLQGGAGERGPVHGHGAMQRQPARQVWRARARDSTGPAGDEGAVGEVCRVHHQVVPLLTKR